MRAKFSATVFCRSSFLHFSGELSPYNIESLCEHVMQMRREGQAEPSVEVLIGGEDESVFRANGFCRLQKLTEQGISLAVSVGHHREGKFFLPIAERRRKSGVISR